MVKEIDQKVFKYNNIQKSNMLPGDPKGFPDESFDSTFVFIDAGFIEKVSKLFGEGKYLKFNRILFAKNLGKKNNLKCDKIFYYTAPPFHRYNPSKAEEKIKEGYDKFIEKLRNDDVIVREGRCQQLKIDGKFEYHQKAVDILLAMDLMDLLTQNKVKSILLISSDSDFVPIIKRLERGNIKTILYTFYEKKRDTRFSRSNHLIKSVYKYKLLTKQDFDDCPLIK
jgi:uncharacterized LabA/DUF88 family protein